MTVAPASVDRMTRLEDEVRRWAEQLPDAVAAQSLSTGVALTWRQVDEGADRLVDLLRERGVGVGDRVAWLGANDPQFTVVLVACRRARAVLAGLNWRLPPPELLRAAAAVRPSLVIGQEDRLAQTDFADAIAVPADGSAPWDDRPRAAQEEPKDDDPLIMFFTSGATGEPKAVTLNRHAQDLAVTEPAAFSFSPGDRQLIVPPQFHLAGSTWTQYGLLHGTTQYYPGDTSPAGLVRALSEQRITHALMVPTLLQMIVDELEKGPVALPDLGDIAYGASPIPAPLLRRLLRVVRCRFTQVYGLSETGGVVVELGPAEHSPDSPHLLAAGRPINTTELRIVDPSTGKDLPTGSSGEIVVRCEHMMTGYFDRDDLTATVLRGGWMHTKDAGHLDADGFVYIDGRVDDMIITGGENVQPADVERVIAELPGVAECAVFGMPDEKWGTAVWAALVREPGVQIDEAAVMAWCRKALAGYQCPRSVVFLDDLPRNATGKLLRRDLPERVGGPT